MESRWQLGEGRFGVQGLSEEDKGLMDTDKSVVIAGRKRV